MSEPGELDCNELVELVTEYLDGALSDSERLRFERHLVYCGGCANHLWQLRQTLRVMAALPDEPIPDTVSARLLVAFRDWKRGSAGEL